MCLGVAGGRAGKRCKLLIIKSLESATTLKIRVSVVRFRPWPPPISLFSNDLQSGCAVEVLVHWRPIRGIRRFSPGAGRDPTHCTRCHLPASAIPARCHRDLCSLVPHLPPELSRSRGFDGGARSAPNPYNDHAMGPSIRARIREEMEPPAKPVGSSWRVDETFIHTRPKMGYLYRAVDKDGKTVDSLFQVGRGIAAAMAFFRKALASCAPRWPRKITLDGHRPSHSGLRRLRREDYRWKYVLVRRSCYLNNVVEQDHRAIKGRCQPMLGFKSYRTAAVTLAGLELVHRIRKRQFKFGPGWWSRWSLKKQWDAALA